MPRRRVFGPTSSDRYISKIQKVFEARGANPEQARKVAELAFISWDLRFRLYREVADGILSKYADRIPRPLRGLYRAVLFRMIKAARKGENLKALVECFARNGLDRALLEELAGEVLRAIEAQE